MIHVILFFFFQLIENLRKYFQNIFIDGLNHKINRINKENSELEKKFRKLDETRVYDGNNKIDNAILM